MKRIVLGFGAAALMVIFGPVIFRQMFPVKAQTLHGVRLQQTTYEDVQFRNETQEIDLAGMLFMPQGEGPFPGAVIIHGSGPSRRDNTWYLTLTQHLQNSGVAVLLPDKRGSEQSSGDWRASSYEDLATDTLAAIDFLQAHDDIAAVGVIGMSQGGQIVPVVASQSGDIEFVVNMVGSSLKAYDLLRYEETKTLQEFGFLPGPSHVIAVFSSWMLVNQSQTDFWDAVGNFDPMLYWEQVSAPVLVLYGDDDHNVPAQASADRLATLSHPDLTINIYPEAGHAVEDRETGQIIREEALADIHAFIERTTGQ